MNFLNRQGLQRSLIVLYFGSNMTYLQKFFTVPTPPFGV